jgi:hypothetical protein
VLLNVQGRGSWRGKRRYRNSLNRFDVAGLPTLVEGGFGRAVEPEDDEIPLARRDLLQIGASAYFRIYLTFHVRGHRDE